MTDVQRRLTRSHRQQPTRHISILPGEGVLPGRGILPGQPFLPGWMCDVIVGVSAASASLIHAVLGGAFISDDWYLRSQHGADWLDEIDRFFRPIQWLVHVVEFSLLGDSAWALALLLSALCAGFGVLFRRVLVRVMGPATAMTAALIWGLSPSTSAIRYWAAAAPILVSMILVATAWHFALRAHVQPSRVTALAALSILTYEAGLPLGACAVVVALVRVSERRAGTVVKNVALFTSVAIWNVATSPKSIEPRILFESVPDIHEALLGPGLTPRGLGSTWLVYFLLRSLLWPWR